jgi:hypothetical protein
MDMELNYEDTPPQDYGASKFISTLRTVNKPEQSQRFAAIDLSLLENLASNWPSSVIFTSDAMNRKATAAANGGRDLILL